MGDSTTQLAAAEIKAHNALYDVHCRAGWPFEIAMLDRMLSKFDYAGCIEKHRVAHSKRKVQARPAGLKEKFSGRYMFYPPV